MKEKVSYAFRVSSNVLVVDYCVLSSGYCDDYDIAPLGLLDETMCKDPECSQLIFHLVSKTWASTELLYDLAGQITRYRPNNKINWVKSFIDVELRDRATQLVDKTYEPVHEPDGSISGWNFGDLMERVSTFHGIINDIRNDAGAMAEVKRKIEGELSNRGIPY